MKKYLFYICVLIFALNSCQKDSLVSSSVSSPSGRIILDFSLNKEGVPQYVVFYNNMAIIDTSSFGFSLKYSKDFTDNFIIESTDFSQIDETWEMPWGEQRVVENNCNEMLVKLHEDTAGGRNLNIRFRVYDDGIGFRYELPSYKGIDSLVIMEENTEFNLTGNHLTWWIPGDWDIYEHLYNTTLFSEIDATSKRNHPNLAQTYIPFNAVNTPVTMKTGEGVYLSFHEANLTDYAGMTLLVDTNNYSMKSGLVGSHRYGYKAKVELPFNTPWRTIQISEKPGNLIESNLIVNLNEPNKLDNISWFNPTKYVGIWWEMHLGKSSWNMGDKHGATTENAKRYIDFASEHGLGSVLIEGWNKGWEHWIGFEDREGVFDFVTPYPDYDLQEVVKYAQERNVEIIMHHETSSAVRSYDLQIDTAFALMKSLEIHTVKTGYVGKIIPEGEYHHGQWMVNHYRKVIETGAKYKVAVNAHEPIKATGIRRTYPNAISREGLRGQEFNAWASDGGNPPEHLPIVAFTRMLAGPIDFTPGVFDIKLGQLANHIINDIENHNQVNTSLAHQLALYVIINSPVQMACDLPENYENHPAFRFIKDVGVNWEQSKVLDGEIGDFVVIARQERVTNNWFVGGITDENARDFTIDFSFLDEKAKYKAYVYKDGEDAHWNDNPTSILIEDMNLSSDSRLTINMAPGGGFAISISVK